MRGVDECEGIGIGVCVWIDGVLVCVSELMCVRMEGIGRCVCVCIDKEAREKREEGLTCRNGLRGKLTDMQRKPCPAEENHHSVICVIQRHRRPYF